MADPEEKKAKKTKSPKPPKDKKAKGDAAKKGGKKKASGAADGQLSVAGHPRASAAVRRAKGWGGLVGFGLAAVLSMKAGVPTADLGARALLAGAAGYLVAWGCAVAAWRAILLAELHARLERAQTDTIDTAGR
jgi:hypothetical protein